MDGSLTGRILIAMPGIGDPRFERSVIVMCMHTPEAAMGLVVNKIKEEITLGDVLEHLADPLDTLRSVNRSLAPGGQVVISIPNVAHLWMRLSLLFGHFDYADHGILDRGHLRFFTQRSLRRLLDDAALDITRWRVTAAPLHRVVGLRWHGRALSAIHAVSSRMAQRFPRLLGYQFVVLARPRAGG